MPRWRSVIRTTVNSLDVNDLVGCAGGLMGNNISSTITECYAAGNVTSSSYYTGGLIGKSECGLEWPIPSPESVIENCYAQGQLREQRMSAGWWGMQV